MDFLLTISARSLVLAAAAGALLIVFRIRSASARHAVWTLVTAGMLAIAIAAATLPAIPIRVLRPVPSPAPVVFAPVPFATVPSTPLPAPPRPFPWTAIYAAGLLVCTARLATGYFLTRRVLRSATRIEQFEDAIFESAAIAVPLTIAGTILLPAAWRTWESAKLDAVLVHERTHVRRGDWAIAALAAVNRCVFWFHPLAWWMEAHLRTLAEQACDDASLSHIARETYAETLVDMAAALRDAKHRVAWEAMAMAKGAEVRMRIERILDDARPLARPITRARWTAMAIAAIPIIFAAALARPAHVRAQQPPPQAQTKPEPKPAPSVAAQPADPDLKRARAALARIESELRTFKQQNMGTLPEQFQTNVTQLNNLQMQLGNVNETIGRLQQEKLMLETQMSNYNNQVEYYRSLNTQRDQFNQRILDAQLQITTMRDMYTEAAPQLKRAEAQLADLERQRDRLDNPANGKMVKDLEGSIALLKTQIVGVNMNMEQQLKRTQELNKVVIEYQSRINVMPQLEERYASLMRQYKEAQDQVDFLAQRPPAATAGPRLVTRHDPEYTAEARQHGIQGKVEVSVTVGADGVLRDIQVVHGLNPGLDQKAVECVKTWRFRAATYQGKPVAAVILVEVPFRLP